MSYENKNLLKEIEALKKELYHLLDEDPSDKDKILETSERLDKLIAEFYHY